MHPKTCSILRDWGWGLWFGKVYSRSVLRGSLTSEPSFVSACGAKRRRAVSARNHDLQFAFEGLAVREIGDVALGHVRVEVIGAAFVQRDAAFENQVAQRAHILRPEGQGTRHAHLDAGPTIVIVARRDHGHAFDLKRELREIGHRRKRKPDIVHLRAASKHAGYQRVFDLDE